MTDCPWTYRQHQRHAAECIANAVAETDGKGDLAEIRMQLFRARQAITRALNTLPNDEPDAA